MNYLGTSRSSRGTVAPSAPGTASSTFGTVVADDGELADVAVFADHPNAALAPMMAARPATGTHWFDSSSTDENESGHGDHGECASPAWLAVARALDWRRGPGHREQPGVVGDNRDDAVDHRGELRRLLASVAESIETAAAPGTPGDAPNPAAPESFISPRPLQRERLLPPLEDLSRRGQWRDEISRKPAFVAPRGPRSRRSALEPPKGRRTGLSSRHSRRRGPRCVATGATTLRRHWGDCPPEVAVGRDQIRLRPVDERRLDAGNLPVRSQ